MQVTVGVFDRKPVEHADPRPLERGVEALRRVDVGRRRRVRVFANVFARRVIDVQVRRIFPADPAIRGQFIRDQDCPGTIHVLEHEGRDGALGVGLAFLRPRPAAALRRHRDHALASAAAALGLVVVGVTFRLLAFLACLAAEIRFVGLDDTLQQPVLVLHHAADALAEEPSGLLADAEMFAQFDGRDTFAAGRDQIERSEPRPQRQVGAFERRAVRDLELRATGVALQIVLAADLVRVVDVAAFRADRSGRPAQGFKMRPACLIIRKPLEEGQQRHAAIMPDQPQKSIGPVPFMFTKGSVFIFISCFLALLGAS